MLGYLSLDIICSSKLTVFLELRSRKIVRFSEQIISENIFAPNEGYCLYNSLVSRHLSCYIVTTQLSLVLFCNGNRIEEWSPLFCLLSHLSVIIRDINKIGRLRSGSPTCQWRVMEFLAFECIRISPKWNISAALEQRWLELVQSKCIMGCQGDYIRDL